MKITSKIDQNIIDIIEELRPLSNDLTDNNLRVNVPTLLRNFSSLKKEYFQDSHRVLLSKFSLQECTLLLTSDIPFSTFQNKPSYMERLDILVKNNYVYPFLFFVNGEFIKWSDIYILRDCRYSYILIKDNFKINGKYEMINLPKNVVYNETGKINANTLFAFKDGKIYEDKNFKDICITIDNGGYKDFYYEELILNINTLQLFSLDPNYEMASDNIMIFKDGLLYTDGFEYHGLNMFSVNKNAIEDGVYKAKGFYYYKINERVNNHRVIMNKQGVIGASVISNKVENYFTIFKDKFNFNFSFKNNYETNIANALNYIMNYNSGLMNKYYERINKTISRIYTGAELKKLAKYDKITMSRRITGDMNTYVLIYQNGELFKYYRELQYINKDFVFPFKGIKDEDTIEILYFLDVDNREFPIVLSSRREDTYYIDFTIDKSHLKLYTQQPQFLDFDIEISPHKQYELDFYYEENEDGTTFLYPKNAYYYDKRLHMISGRQFRYHYFKAPYSVIDVILPPSEFKYCTNPDQYMLYINKKKIPTYNYKVILPVTDKPYDDYSIYFNIPLDEGDEVEIFYIPDLLSEVHSEVDLNPNGNIYLDKTKLRHNIDKNLDFIFVNGKKIPSDCIYEVSQTLVKITTDIESVRHLSIIQHVETNDVLHKLFDSIKDKMTNIIEGLSDTDFYKLFNDTYITDNDRDVASKSIDMKTVAYSLINDYYCSPFVHTGEDFIYDNSEKFFNEYDPDGNLIIDEFNGNRNNKPLRGRDDGEYEEIY